MVSGDPSFELAEDHAFLGAWSWRLKDGQIRFRGANRTNKPVDRITVSTDQLGQFVAVLNFLEAWEWRPDYDTQECEYVTLDGISWKFTALIDGRMCNAEGWNAYPSFADVKKASWKVERYGLLRASMRDIFGIDSELPRVF